ncbi:CoA transferase (plasmid) [Diaphorobacter sp. HDW4B]|uniref:CaiB/BaiF CoA transferase family protein n=1 Tax=Diaphorobacter sp. HDW4B TaxID=2714925 RepID=UPI0014085EE9|nr:CoA transferase [Diaphorobacter sp. HDW4B]
MRVVEIGSIGPAPFACMMLADMGADIVRVERGGEAAIHERGATVRGRKTITLDLKNDAARASLLSLMEQSDVLVEGFRPGVMERLGLGPEVLHARNPRLVYARMTGWGQRGPRASTAGHDLNYIALSGAVHAMGDKDRPPPVPLNLVGDYGGGALYLVSGVLAACYEAQKSGLGQVVDVAICDAAVSLMSLFHSLSDEDEWRADRSSNLLDGAAPFYRTYVCKDGKYLSVGAIEPQFYVQLRERAGWNDECFDYQHNRSRWPEMNERAEQIMRTRTRDEWVAVFAGTDACVAPVLELRESRTDQHLIARDCFVTVDKQVQPAPAPRFSRTPSSANASVGIRSLQEVKKQWSAR